MSEGWEPLQNVDIEISVYDKFLEITFIKYAQNNLHQVRSE